MSSTTPRTFDQTRRLAKHLGERLKIIEEKMPYSNNLRGSAKQLSAVYEAMSVIAETPNASINETALMAFGKYIDEAIERIKSWAKELITPDDDDLDEIPF